MEAYGDMWEEEAAGDGQRDDEDEASGACRGEGAASEEIENDGRKADDGQGREWWQERAEEECAEDVAPRKAEVEGDGEQRGAVEQPVHRACMEEVEREVVPPRGGKRERHVGGGHDAEGQRQEEGRKQEEGV